MSIAVAKPFDHACQTAQGGVTTPTIREASFADYDRISALQVAHGRPVKPYEEWVHLWTKNPAYAPYRDTMPIGWVVELQDKTLVGYLGNIPLFYELEGRRLLVAVAHAWVVDVAYRPYSLALLDLYFAQKKIDIFLNATVGPAGFQSFSVFNSPRVPAGEWDRSVYWITNSHGFVCAWMADKSVPLKKLLRYGLAAALEAWQFFSASRPSDHTHVSTLSLCPAFDERFDVFWESLRQRNPGRLLAVRSREFLEWHFHFPLLNDSAWIVTAGADAIEAYAIFVRYDNPRVSLKRMRLVDYQSLDGTTKFLKPMVRYALKKCHRDRIHMLESIGLRADKSAQLNRLKPRVRELPCWLYFYKARNAKLSETLTHPDRWDPSQFDGDASL